ncbi:uncharacterized protein LOC128882310, partial [Hylaeus volcanicus]|uniref:uncharacterized protein LOC128882310 n=1 Tax=Hylaeus volcanicus TaxID=313075 RepID=UPI0023B79437
MEIEEEEERQPVLTVGYQDNVGPGTRRDSDALAYNVLPGSSRGCTVKRNQVQPAIRKGLKGDILKMIRSSNLTKPRKLKIYKAVARILKSARQLRRRRSSVRQRIGKIEHLVQTGFHQVLESLPTPLHAMLLAQMRNADKQKSARRFTEEEKILALSIYKQSSKAYRYLAKLFLLPSIETLRKLIPQIPLKAGICDNVFEELKQQCELFTDPKSRYACLIFDEISLAPSLQYNTTIDVIDGFVDSGFSRNLDIADHATVWMLKGIHGVRPWKQPVAYSFCKGSSSVENLV